MPDIQYRRLEENREDLQKIVDFLIATFGKEHEMGSLSASKFSFAKGLPFVVAAIECGAWVAEDEGEIVGSVGLQITSPWYTEAQYMGDLWTYVTPEYREHGVAGRLVELAKDHATDKSMPLMMGIFNNVDVDRKIKFFEKMGFRMVGAQFLRDKEQ